MSADTGSSGPGDMRTSPPRYTRLKIKFGIGNCQRPRAAVIVSCSDLFYQNKNYRGFKVFHLHGRKRSAPPTSGVQPFSSVALAQQPHLTLLLAAVTALGLLIGACSNDAPRGDEQLGLRAALEAGFSNPPASARPRTWWHWMNGNVTEDGIRKDLEWMSRVGLGGVQNFDAGLNTPQIVEQRLTFMSDEWRDAFRFAVSTANDLGLEYSIPASPGWSETGGPWVPPEDGMKKLVWSEVVVPGGTTYSGQLPAPPDTTGPYQDVPYFDPLAGGAGDGEKPTFYADAAVLAYPVSIDAMPLPSASTDSGAAFDPGALLDADLTTTFALPFGGDQPAMVYAYAEPVTVRSATVFVPHARPPFRDSPYLPVLEAETDSGWEHIASLPLLESRTTVSFAPVTARRYRLSVGPNTEAIVSPLGSGAPGAQVFDIFARPTPEAMPIAEWTLSSEARVHRGATKAGFSIELDYYELSSGPSPDVSVSPDDVVDLTAAMADDGTLEWAPPAGSDWRIVRLGYSLTGKTNHPAAPEATGLEVDKFDGDAVRRYLENYLDMYRQATGDELMGARGLHGLLTDSIEVDEANWTPGMAAKFEALRGYDPTPWLPVLTGAVIGSPAESDAFLYDFRQTLADLLVNEHYATVAEVARENGMIVYGEALENLRPVLGDDLAMRKHTSVPMAAMWMYNRGTEPRYTLFGDMKGASSVAHIYGQNLVAAESMTSASSPWAFAPHDLKRVIDLEFAHGVNRPVIHTSVHQPVDDRVPGLSLMIFGQYFNRHETWAEMAAPWIDYIARTSFLLQQGRDHSDVAYFYGEETPITVQYGFGLPPDLPKRYAYDLVNADILKNVLSVEDGELVAPSGARYKLLFLSGTSDQMTLPTLERIAELVEAGATVVGSRPTGSPSLADDGARFNEVADRLWSGKRETRVGQGRVIVDDDVEAVLEAQGISADFDAGDGTGNDVWFVHRHLNKGDLYFVNNRRDAARQVEARFRVTGKRPEIWHAIDAKRMPVSWRIDGDQTVVQLDMAAEDAFFVVFLDGVEETQNTVVPAVERVVAEIDGPWRVRFQEGRGAPEATELETAGPLNENADAGVRYFSGVSTWQTTFARPGGSGPVFLNLGDVGDVAEVYVNGEHTGTAWFPPFRVDVTDALAVGDNQLEVRVANLWVNRLVGDKQAGAEAVTFTAAPTYLPDAPLRPAGLLGPVRLVTTE